jgi:hypothetical protein
MQIRLPTKWTQYLLSQPESGMGYQRVALRLRDGRTIADVLIFNAEQVEVKENVELRPEEIVEITVAK